MEIWVGKNLKLEFSVVICLCIYYYIYEINQLLNTYKDAAGIWHEDRFRPLVTALVNLGLNLVMVQFWGIYGIILSTVLSMLIVGMPWLLHNLFTVLFSKDKLKPYLWQLIKYVSIVTVGCIITYILSDLIVASKWMTLIFRAIICCCIPNIIYFVAFRNKNEFKQSVALIDNMTKHKIKFLQKLL